MNILIHVFPCDRVWRRPSRIHVLYIPSHILTLTSEALNPETAAFTCQVQESAQQNRVSGTVLPRLREYAEQVLEAAYDVLMDNVRGDLEPGLGISRLAKEDFLRFLQLTAFFTAYVRGKQVRRRERAGIEQSMGQ